MRSAAAEQYGVLFKLGNGGLLYRGQSIIWSAHYQLFDGGARNIHDGFGGGDPIVFQLVNDGSEGMAQKFYYWENGHYMHKGIWGAAQVILTVTPLPGGVFV